MASHADLVAELATMDKMSMSDRLKLSKKRRAAQLKAYAQYEKQMSKSAGGRRGKKTSGHASSSSGGGSSSSSKRTGSQVCFADSVLLLDATVRDDIDEGTYMNVLAGVECAHTSTNGERWTTRRSEAYYLKRM